MTPQEQLDEIKPGKNYPSFVRVVEKVPETNETLEVTFTLQSYYVGMYCAINVNGQLANQNGDHDNRKFVRNLKKDIQKAIERGATVEIGSLRPCKLEP